MTAILSSPRWLSPESLRRFWSKVDQSGGPDACWPYRGCIRKRDGYGHVGRAGKTYSAARFALMLSLGRQLDEDELALHKCNTRACCNVSPKHVYLGDHEQNMLDCVASGNTCRGERHYSKTMPQAVARGERHASRTHPESLARGERVAGAKLTAERVVEIRLALSEGKSQRAIGRTFGVTQSLVSQVSTGLIWRHVQ